MKVKRQSKILELIRENDIETQEMLADLLNKAGFNVTQATVSRDIRELKLTKATMQSGNKSMLQQQKKVLLLQKDWIEFLEMVLFPLIMHRILS